MGETLEESREYWDLHARRDPLWAVLSDSTRRDRGWGVQSFMATGEREISILFHHLASLDIAVPAGRALDFGCGVGRLSQALATRFSSVVGLDISPRMIAVAEKLNQFPDSVRYLVHQSPELGAIAVPPFDFIYSNIVLQHIDPGLTPAYLASFVRALTDGGLLVFQMPSHRAPQAAAPQPMADSAYRAVISTGPVPVSALNPGSELTLDFEVRNESTTEWNQDTHGSIRLGNHWLTASNEMLIQDDARAQLPMVLAPGASHVLQLTVKVPPRPGRYILEVDAVHEAVTWFGDRGSPTWRTSLLVGNAASTEPSPLTPVRGMYDDQKIADALEPIEQVPSPSDFPMHAIERDQVVEILVNAGGRIERVEEDDHARPDFVGYKFFVRRDVSGSLGSRPLSGRG